MVNHDTRAPQRGRVYESFPGVEEVVTDVQEQYGQFAPEEVLGGR